MSIINEALRKLEKGKEGEPQKPAKMTAPIVQEKDNPVPDVQLAKTPVEELNARQVISTQKIIVIACLVLLGFVSIMMLSGPNRKTVLKNPGASSQQAASAKASFPAVSEVKEQPALLNKFIDPLGARSGLRLTGTMLGNGAPLAIINNRIVSEGEEVNGAIVRKIATDTVTLSYQGQELILKEK